MFKLDKADIWKTGHKFLISRYAKIQNAIDNSHRSFYSTRNHYDILNLKRDCTNQEIRDAFATLSKKFHPDTCQSGTSEQNAVRFREIMAAYKVLCKKDTRASYDATLIPYNNYSRTASSDYYRHNQYSHMEYEILRRRARAQGPRPFYYYADRKGHDWEKQRAQNNITTTQIFVFLIGLFIFNNFFIALSARRRERMLHDHRIEPEQNNHYWISNNRSHNYRMDQQHRPE